jgi:hypothetical protein
MRDERTMTSKTLMIAAAVVGALMLTSGVLQAGAGQPSERELTRAVTQYLSDHGDLCVGKFAWPRVVTQQDQVAHTNDAVQLPVLEHLGLVESTEISAPAVATPASWTPPAPDAAGNAAVQSAPQSGSTAATVETAKRYSLTAKGQRYYLQKKRITLGAHDQPVEHDKDLCVARLSLDKVVKWSPPEQVHGRPETVVRYTYHVKSVDWMADPQARQVFPVVDRIIRNQDNMLMSVTVALQDGKWVPVLPTQ